MVFTSTIFLFLFLPLTAFSHYIMQAKYRNLFLFIMSSVFYYYGEQNLLFLMYGVILINWLTAFGFEQIDSKIVIDRYKLLYRKILLILCIILCIGILWYYKYWGFTISIFNDIFTLLGCDYSLSLVDKIILPLGISFYTFHCLSYTFDVYLKKMSADHNLLNFMCYVLMFPQLVAGPIVRYIDIKKQFEHRSITLIGINNGIRKFCFGLAKKVLIANTVALSADRIFDMPIEQLDFVSAWFGAICYTLQIYFDFSGYSDMAIGLAMLFGFRYKENFNYPYISRSVSEFWRRWHISLSSWLKDYVYISLGGNRVARWRYYFNLIMVMLLSGLWHGAQFTFVLWGLWYGIFMVIEVAGFRNILQRNSILAHIYSLFVIIFGWVIFRSVDLEHCFLYWKIMCIPVGITFDYVKEFASYDILFTIVMGMFFSIDWRSKYKKIVLAMPLKNKIFIAKISSMIIASILLILSVMSIFTNSYNPFIYFRF